MDATQWHQPPATTTTTTTTHGLYMGIYGWRKRCLYFLMLLLLFTVTLNLTLVFWIMNVLSLNTNGMRYMSMLGREVHFSGPTYILDLLVASGFHTRGKPISIQSAENLTLRTIDHAGYIASNIYMGEGKFEINTPSFNVTDTWGKTLFSVDKDTVSLTSSSLSISGEGGAILEGSLQTPIIRGDIRSDLVLESAMKAVQALTTASISIESRAGDILAASHQDISLVTVDGSIKLESVNVLMPTLKHPQAQHQGPQHQGPQHHLRKHHRHTDRIYQLCVCSGGELYLGEADASCESALNSLLCR